ncbi:MAG: hypothetical protein AAF706_02825 [Bacteroidota bacterium]
MRSRSRQTLSRILLVALFLQSCGVDVPTGAVREDDNNIHAEGLLHFIKIHQLQAVSQVPTTLKILGDLWQDNSDNLQQHRAPMGLPTLYRRLSDYVWGQ